MSPDSAQIAPSALVLISAPVFQNDGYRVPERRNGRPFLAALPSAESGTCLRATLLGILFGCFALRTSRFASKSSKTATTCAASSSPKYSMSRSFDTVSVAGSIPVALT